VEGDLEQEITQFFPKFSHVTALNGIRNFISFFDGIGGDSLERLFEIPWTAAFRTTQAGHDLKQANEFVSCALVAGRGRWIHEAVPVDFAGLVLTMMRRDRGVDDITGMD
jgi:hypothetical protein